MPRSLDATLRIVDEWGVPNVAAAVVPAGGTPATHGEVGRTFRVASIGKLVTGYAVMVGVEEGAVALDDPAGPPGSTLELLLTHAAGYGFDSDAGVIAAPRTRRVYSNRGIEEAARHLETAAGIPFADYLAEAVLGPLGMSATELRGSPAHGLYSTVADLTRFVAELRAPTLLAPESLRDMISVHVPGLPGVLPGVGRFDPLDWGLTFDRNFGRPGHWAGDAVSRSAYGHFGGAGTFLWVDPEADVASVVLGDREFGPWALEAWPPFCTALVQAAQA